MLLCLFAPLLILTCKSPKHVTTTRVPPLPDRADRADPLDPVPLPVFEEPTIRVLLAEDFGTLEVVGDRRASPLRIEALGDRIQLFRETGSGWEPFEAGSGFRLLPAGKDSLSLNGHRYRGFIDLFVNPLGEAVAVNEVPLEAYLRSVVPKELGPWTYPELEALKAQAVAARTFALVETGRYAERGFDLFDDERSQVYGGLATEHPLSNRAVSETEGVVAVYRGRPIYALYCSTCGGRTEAFDQIFRGGPVPYLAGGAACPEGTGGYARWEERIGVASIRRRIDRYAGVGRLRDLEILQRSEVGRTVRMRFSGEEGEAVLEGLDIRLALGLRSNWIVSLGSRAGVDGFIEELLVQGRGWGHGVGLCQVGAVEMARQGSRFDEILRHYYRGIQLEDQYGQHEQISKASPSGDPGSHGDG